MPKRSARNALFLILIVAAWAVPATRSVYAIKDAKIYPVSGPMIARGTVVIRNGLIDAVGANVSIPPEATIIDATGLTVYPGLIDSFSDAGLPPELVAAPAAGQRGGGQRGAGQRGPATQEPQQRAPQN